MLVLLNTWLTKMLFVKDDLVCRLLDCVILLRQAGNLKYCVFGSPYLVIYVLWIMDHPWYMWIELPNLITSHKPIDFSDLHVAHCIKIDRVCFVKSNEEELNYYYGHKTLFNMIYFCISFTKFKCDVLVESHSILTPPNSWM